MKKLTERDVTIAENAVTDMEDKMGDVHSTIRGEYMGDVSLNSFMDAILKSVLPKKQKRRIVRMLDLMEQATDELEFALCDAREWCENWERPERKKRKK